MDNAAHKDLLIIRGIDVFHGAFQALWDLSLEVRSGEMLALIGANASGKSTLLDTISGLVRPSSGSIVLEGREITRLMPYRIVELGITQIPEGRLIFPDMTVFDNLDIGSYNRAARPLRDKNLLKVYERFPILKTRRKQIAKTLSGGEQQMLAIGRGLMSNPKLILLDEMSLGLAPIIINELFKALKQIRDQGITILFVEQNVRRTLQEADRAYILETGRVVMNGTPEELQGEDQVKKAYFGL